MIEEIQKIEDWIQLYRNSQDRISLSYTRLNNPKCKITAHPSYREMVVSEPLFRLLFESVTGKPITEDLSTLSETNGYQRPDWYLAHLRTFARKLIIDEVLEEL